MFWGGTWVVVVVMFTLKLFLEDCMADWEILGILEEPHYDKQLSLSCCSASRPLIKIPCYVNKYLGTKHVPRARQRAGT